MLDILQPAEVPENKNKPIYQVEDFTFFKDCLYKYR